MAANVGSLLIEIGADIARLRQDMGQVQTVLSQSARTMQNTMAGVGTAIAGAFSVSQVANFTVAITEAAARAQRLQTAFSSIAGSRSGGAASLDGLRSTTKALGLEFYSAAEGAKSFFASSKGTKIEQDASRIFGAVSTAAAALQLSADDTQGVFRALGQMMSKGKVQAEELRGQLGERLPGAFQLAADAMGVTTQQLDKMMEQGQVLASDLLPKLADVLLNKYAGPASEAAHGLAAELNRLQTAWTDLKTSMSDPEAAANGVRTLANAVDALAVSIRAAATEQKALMAAGAEMGAEWDPWSGQRIVTRNDVSAYRFRQRSSDVSALARAEVRQSGSALTQTMGGGDYWLGISNMGEAAEAAARGEKLLDAAMKEAEQTANKHAQALRTVRQEYVQLFGSEAQSNVVKWQEQYAQLVKVLGADNPDLQRLARMQDLRLRNQLSPDQITQYAAMPDLALARLRGQEDADKRGEQMLAKQDDLVTQFAERAAQVLRGRTDLQLALLQEEVDAYERAGVDKVQLEEYAQQRRLEIATNAGSGIQRALEQYVRDSQDMASQMENAVTSAFGGMEDALVDFVTTGKPEFSDLIDSMVSDLVRLAVKQSITGPLASALGSAMGGLFMASANGNVFSGPGIGAYSSSIVSRPTVFPFAKGIGLMGEAGAEAIMPLTRTSDGKLGVQAVGGDGAAMPTMEIRLVNQSGTQLKTKQVAQSYDNANRRMSVELLLDAIENSQAVRSSIRGVR